MDILIKFLSALTGRSYEAEIGSILLLLRFPFCFFHLKSIFSVRGFDTISFHICIGRYGNDEIGSILLVLTTQKKTPHYKVL